MRLDKYIPEGQHYQHLADIRQVGVARVFLEGIEAKRDELREQNETRPMLSDEDITKDFRFKAGAIWALNWALSLPEEARKYIQSLPTH